MNGGDVHSAAGGPSRVPSSWSTASLGVPSGDTLLERFTPISTPLLFKNDLQNMVASEDLARCSHVQVFLQRQPPCGNVLLCGLLCRCALQPVVVHDPTYDVDTILVDSLNDVFRV